MPDPPPPVNTPSSQQSPVNLHDPVYADLGENGLEIHWAESIHGHVVKDDRGIRVAFDPDYRQFIRLSGEKFHLLSFHFHSPSEHWVEGEQYPIELHVVHQNANDATLAVVAIFIDAAEANSPVPAPPALITQMLDVLGIPIEQRTSSRVSTNPRDFLPDDTAAFYRYEGSLTTYPYSENVSWAVLREPFLLSELALESLKAHFEEPARFPCPLNRRFLLATFRTNETSARAQEIAPSTASSPKAPRQKNPRKKGKPA